MTGGAVPQQTDGRTLDEIAAAVEAKAQELMDETQALVEAADRERARLRGESGGGRERSDN